MAAAPATSAAATACSRERNSRSAGAHVHPPWHGSGAAGHQLLTQRCRLQAGVAADDATALGTGVLPQTLDVSTDRPQQKRGGSNSCSCGEVARGSGRTVWCGDALSRCPQVLCTANRGIPPAKPNAARPQQRAGTTQLPLVTTEGALTASAIFLYCTRTELPFTAGMDRGDAGRASACRPAKQDAGAAGCKMRGAHAPHRRQLTAAAGSRQQQ